MANSDDEQIEPNDFSRLAEEVKRSKDIEQHKITYGVDDETKLKRLLHSKNKKNLLVRLFDKKKHKFSRIAKVRARRLELA